MSQKQRKTERLAATNCCRCSLSSRHKGEGNGFAIQELVQRTGCARVRVDHGKCTTNLLVALTRAAHELHGAIQARIRSWFGHRIVAKSPVERGMVSANAGQQDLGMSHHPQVSFHSIEQEDKTLIIFRRGTPDQSGGLDPASKPNRRLLLKQFIDLLRKCVRSRGSLS